MLLDPFLQIRKITVREAGKAASTHLTRSLCDHVCLREKTVVLVGFRVEGVAVIPPDNLWGVRE